MRIRNLPTGVSRSNTFTNPILRGGYPDPSICRVGEDYYLVNSSFEYFPGLPLHHSRDLVNWELVGYGLHREEQCTGAVNLMDVQTRGGIHAPTLRFHNAIFYLITTNVYSLPGVHQPAQCINFILTAKAIEGPWSQPHILEGAPGIDPDIFFDDDGSVWYTGTHTPENPNFKGEGEIWLQALDLENWALTGERYYLWRGACGGTWVEGPHLYKRDGRYYLLVAEGGTSLHHAVMVAVSDHITGPYLSNPRNPILTSRHLSYDHWVNSTGHGDLVELPDGRWYMVALGIRGDEERTSNMGRETHLIPVVWEREPFEWKEIKYEWPVCAPLTGCVERLNPMPFECTEQHHDGEFFDSFDTPTLHPAWNFRRVPLPDTYSLEVRPGYLRLYARPEVIRERGRYSFMGIRQKESDFEYIASMQFLTEEEGVEAGVILLQQDDNYLKYTITHQKGRYLLRLLLAEANQPLRVLEEDGLEEYGGEVHWNADVGAIALAAPRLRGKEPVLSLSKDIPLGEILLRVVSKNHRYRYTYSLDGGNSYLIFTETGANLILSRGYTGAYLGLYATSNGNLTEAYADFDWVRVVG